MTRRSEDILWSKGWWNTYQIDPTSQIAYIESLGFELGDNVFARKILTSFGDLQFQYNDTCGNTFTFSTDFSDMSGPIISFFNKNDFDLDYVDGFFMCGIAYPDYFIRDITLLVSKDGIFRVILRDDVSHKIMDFLDIFEALDYVFY